MKKAIWIVALMMAICMASMAQVKTTVVADQIVPKAKPSEDAPALSHVTLKRGETVLIYEYFDQDSPFWSAKVGMQEFYIQDADIEQTIHVIARKSTSVASRKAMIRRRDARKSS